MKNKKFTFLIPNSTWNGKRYWHNFPYVEGLLTGVLKKHGYDVDVIDGNLDNLTPEQIADQLRDLKPELLGISTLTLEYKDSSHQAFAIAKEVNPEVITIMGGIYPTMSPDIVTKDENIDYVVLGEGEDRLPRLLDAIEAGHGFDKIDGLAWRENGSIQINEMQEVLAMDLNNLPLPNYGPFDMERYTNYLQKYTQNFRFKKLPIAVTMASRGCQYRCTFCSCFAIYSQAVRDRSSDNVLSEVDMLIEKHGIKEFVFVDDAFFYDKPKAIRILQGLKDRREAGYDLTWKSNNLGIAPLADEALVDLMLEAGAYQMIVSIESGSKNTLKRMKKPVSLPKARKTLQMMSKKGFDDLSSNFVIGMPGDTWEDIRESFRWVEKQVDDGLLDYVVFHIATPFPGTEVYTVSKENGWLPDDFNFEDPKYYGFGRGVITTPDFTPQELQALRTFEWDRINFKTPEKREKIAQMLGITMDELEAWRMDTRRSNGLQVETTDKRQEQEQEDLLSLVTEDWTKEKDMKVMGIPVENVPHGQFLYNI